MKCSNGFHLIFEQEKLRELVNFLKLGFGWNNDEKSTKLINHLKQQPTEFPKGAIYVKNEKIVIGILFFYQGYNKIQKKHIINLSSWYAEKSYRAIEALIFAKSFTKALDEYIITDYTPSYKTSKILKTMKYNNMHVRKMVLGLAKNFPFFDAKIPFRILSFKNSIRTQPINIEKNNKTLNQLAWLYKMHQLNKLGISFSVMTLVGHKENFKLNAFWLLKMIIRHRILKINLIFNDNEYPTNDVWLIKNSSNDFFVSPERSELVI